MTGTSPWERRVLSGLPLLPVAWPFGTRRAARHSGPESAQGYALFTALWLVPAGVFVPCALILAAWLRRDRPGAARLLAAFCLLGVTGSVGLTFGVDPLSLPLFPASPTSAVPVWFRTGAALKDHLRAVQVRPRRKKPRPPVPGVLPFGVGPP